MAALALSSLARAGRSGLVTTDLVLLSKSDLFDTHGVVESYVGSEMRLLCHLPAFRVYVGHRLDPPPS